MTVQYQLPSSAVVNAASSRSFAATSVEQDHPSPPPMRRTHCSKTKPFAICGGKFGQLICAEDLALSIVVDAECSAGRKSPIMDVGIQLRQTL